MFFDVRDFLLRRPAVSTLVDFASTAEREDYSHRILQRLDIDVANYAILNIHRIGIDAPVTFVFEQLKTWCPQSSWWPNRLARVEAANGSPEHIRVYFLGRKKHFLGIQAPFFGLNVIPLFEAHALTVREVPRPLEYDNARYMLYRCSGGYPVGIAVAYVRTPIASRDEPDQTQFFFAVGFDFYGKDDWPETHLINSIWERIHNRVTANVLNRFKLECESRFGRVLAPQAPVAGSWKAPKKKRNSKGREAGRPAVASKRLQS